MDTLVRESKQPSAVAKTQAHPFRELANGRARRMVRPRVGLRCRRARLHRLRNAVLGVLRHPYVFVKHSSSRALAGPAFLRKHAEGVADVDACSRESSRLRYAPSHG